MANVGLLISVGLLVMVGLSTASDVRGTEFDDHSIADDKTKGPYKVYRIYPNDTRQLEFLKTVWKSASKMQLNFWKDPTHVGKASDIMVPPQIQESFESLLGTNDIDFLVTIRDVQKLIVERERQENRWHKDIMADDVGLRVRGQPTFDFRRYHSYEEIRQFMRDLEKRYPKIAKVYSLGFSHQNRPIEMIKIGNPIGSTSKKAIWIDAGIHAREWASHSTAVYFINQLVTKYDKDPQIQQYVDNMTWYITPCLNPDGYEYSRSSRDPEIRLWRKNRSPNSDKCRNSGNCCMGVDLNRNFDFHWGESGASDNPCEEIYQGSYVFSEPESRAVRDFVLSHKREIEVFMTLHTYSQLWIHPFGHQKYIYPPDVGDLKSTAEKATKALEKMYGTRYKVGSGADTLYPASGGSDDWSKSKAGVKFVYLLELRPEEEVYDGFILDSSLLIPTGRETWEGLKVVVNQVLENNGVPLVQAQSRKHSGRKRVRTVFRKHRHHHHNKKHEHGMKLTKNRGSSSAENGETDSSPSRLLFSRNSIVDFKAQDNSTTSAALLTTDWQSSWSSSSPPLADLFSPSSSSSSLTTWFPVVERPAVASCVDFAGEERCRRWSTNRVGICQRLPEYMRQNCAKTCDLC